MNEELYQKVTRLETTVESHSKLLEKQQEKNDNQTELNTLLKLQIEANKEQNQTMERFGQTLDRIDINLTQLNSKQSLLDDRVTGIEQNLDKQNLSMIDIIKYVGATLFGLAVGYFAMKLGIK